MFHYDQVTHCTFQNWRHRVIMWRKWPINCRTAGRRCRRCSWRNQRGVITNTSASKIERCSFYFRNRRKNLFNCDEKKYAHILSMPTGYSIPLIIRTGLCADGLYGKEKFAKLVILLKIYVASHFNGLLHLPVALTSFDLYKKYISGRDIEHSFVSLRGFFRS